jgi:outer membrane protein assembly factor BamB
MKGSQASATPVTDGRHLVVILGTAGLLVTYDLEGTLLWKKDLGLIDPGNPYDAKDQWGHSSSPIIYDGAVIIQIDRQKDSFVAAFDVAEGTELWRTHREEALSSSFGTPTIARGKLGDELVTNGTRIRGYDPKTGKQRWTLEPNSIATVPTPIAGPDLVYVTAGYPPLRPIYAIRPGSGGDISLPAGASSSDAIAWSYSNGGSYIPTPILYRGVFYALSNNGIIVAYDPRTGAVINRARIGKNGGAFTASPVASDGRLYCVNEDGEVYVLKAGRDLTLLARNDMNEIVAATPAISNGVIVIRTLGHVYGIGEREENRQ